LQYRLIATALVCLTLVPPSDAQDPTGVIARNTRQEMFEAKPLGMIHVLVPTNEIKSVVIFIDGDGGWNTGIGDMAQLLANEGALVAGVDTIPYLQSLDTGDTACASPAGDFEQLSRVIAERYGLTDSVRPILVGYSSGATLAYAVLAQAPKHTFRGAITLGFCETLEVRRPFCRGSDLALRHSKEGLVFFPARKLSAPWSVLQGEIDQACTAAEVADFIRAIPTAKLVALPKVGHGFAVARRWQPQYVAAFREMAVKAD